MRFNLKPNQPRPISRVHGGTSPGHDLRWRYIAAGIVARGFTVLGEAHSRVPYMQAVDSTRQHERVQRLERS